MKRSRIFFVQGLVLLTSSILFGSLCLAKIPEPSAVYYGNVMIGAMPITAQNTSVQVALRIGDTVVSTYQMGTNSELGNQYLLIVPMDAVGAREPNSGRQGDVATILVSGIEAETFAIGGKGRFVQKHLSVTSSDTDNDGMSDLWENENGLNPFDASDAAEDADGDGLSNLEEFNAQTDPNSTDTDGDGMSDWFEVTYGLKPLDASDAAEDADGDGYTNLEEAQNGTNPNAANEVEPFRIEIARFIDAHSGNVAALIRNNEKLISASQHEPLFKIWNLADGQLDSSTDSGSLNGINALAVSGNLLFVGTGDSNVLQYDITDGDPVLMSTFAQAQGSILALTVFNDQLIAGAANGTVNIWNISTSAHTSWTAQEGIFISGVSASDNKLYTMGSFPKKRLIMWDWGNQDSAFSISVADTCCESTNMHLNQKTLYITGLNGPGLITAIDLTNLDSDRYIGQIHNTASLAGANLKLFSGDGNGMVNVWSMISGSQLLSFKAHGQPIHSMIVTDTQLMTGDESGRIKIWDLYNDDVAGDKDFDGMLDSWELAHDLDPNSNTDQDQDADNDGLTNLVEYINQTDPRDTDTDGDQMPDKWELDHNLNPNDPTDANADPDGDSLTNLQEYQGGTNPHVVN